MGNIGYVCTKHYFIVMNLLSVIALAMDQFRKTDIQDNYLHLISFFGGALGSLIGILFFRKKSTLGFFFKTYIILMIQCMLFCLSKRKIVIDKTHLPILTV